MEATAPIKTAKINRWLPYWAVFQADLRQTLRSWVYRVWVLVSLLLVAGFLLYKSGIHHHAGMVQNASEMVSSLLRWTLLGSASLIIVLTAGSISSERGTLADSVLSRGISRYQYFCGKWHARLTVVLGTFFAVGLAALLGTYFLLDVDLTLIGSLVALVAVAAFLAVVISCGVTVSALFNSTLLGVSVLWIVVYGCGFALSLLPERVPSPDRLLVQLPFILKGEFNLVQLGRTLGWSAAASVGVALVGIVHFARRDV